MGLPWPALVLATLVCPYAPIRSQESYLGAGTKRPYLPLDQVMDDPTSTLPYAPDTDYLDGLLDSCRADNGGKGDQVVFVAKVSRHGARYPTKSKLRKALEAAQMVCGLGLKYGSPARRWCERTIEALAETPAGVTAPLGYVELRSMGAILADNYFHQMKNPQMVVYTTRERRTKESCEAFKDGADDIWPQAANLTCKEDERLLRPYVTCPYLNQLRPKLLDHIITDRIVEAARGSMSEVLGVPANRLSRDVVLGAYYACQTDLTIFNEFNTSFACRMVERSLPHFEVTEDLENYHIRGFGHEGWRHLMAPLLRKITARMEKANEDSHLADLYFSHDSTVLPFVALLDVLNLGQTAEASKAARFCPFSSRVLIEKYACGLIIIKYNDVVVRVFEGGMEEWKRVYSYHLDPEKHDQRMICGSYNSTYQEL